MSRRAAQAPSELPMKSPHAATMGEERGAPSDVAEAFLDQDHDAHLTLPVDPAQLISTVKSLLRPDRADVTPPESQGRYRRIIDTALEGIWTIDSRTNTTYVNRQMTAMLGQSAAEMIGRSLYDFMEEETRWEAVRNFEHARQGLKGQFDARFRRADGRDLMAIVSTHPIFDEDGPFAGALVVITDITSRKRAESARCAAETLRSVAALAAAVNHEINNPLMCVIGNLDLLERTGRLDAYGRARVQAALAAADEITMKVRRFGRITRLELADDGLALPPMLDLEKSSQGLGDEC